MGIAIIDLYKRGKAKTFSLPKVSKVNGRNFYIFNGGVPQKGKDI